MAGRILAYYALLLLCILKNYTSEKILQSWDFLLGLISCHMQSEWVSLSSVQSLRCVQLFATPWATAHQASRLITSSRSLLKLMAIEALMSSNHVILCCPLLLLPSIFPSIRVFSIESVLHIRWPKYWSFSFSISPSKDYSGLISLRIDWIDLLAIQGTINCVLQYHSSKASILLRSPSFMFQLSHLYMTTGKP